MECSSVPGGAENGILDALEKGCTKPSKLNSREYEFGVPVVSQRVF